MKRYFTFMATFFVLVFILICLTGCWNRKELGDLGIVGAAAIDVINDEIMLTVELIEPKNPLDPGANSDSVSFFQAQGKTVFDAIRNATLKSDKKLYWSHANAFYFNEEAARKGISSYLDYFIRDHEPKGYIHLFIAKNSPAYELIGVAGRKNQIPSEYAENLAENYEVNGKSVSSKMMDFLKQYYQKGIQPVIGILHAEPRTHDLLKASIDENGTMMLSNEGCAVFQSDKLVGYLDARQTRGYNFATGKIKSTMIISPSLDAEGKTSMEVIRASGKIEIKATGETLCAKITVHVDGALGEDSGLQDIANAAAIWEMENLASQTVKSEIVDAVEKAQLFHSDIFGFGAALHRSNPKEWEQRGDNWNEIFSELPIEVIVKTSIQRIGGKSQQLRAYQDASPQK